LNYFYKIGTDTKEGTVWWSEDSNVLFPDLCVSPLFVIPCFERDPIMCVCVWNLGRKKQSSSSPCFFPQVLWVRHDGGRGGSMHRVREAHQWCASHLIGG
jgi:hypothetical protein